MSAFSRNRWVILAAPMTPHLELTRHELVSVTVVPARDHRGQRSRIGPITPCWVYDVQIGAYEIGLIFIPHRGHHVRRGDAQDETYFCGNISEPTRRSVPCAGRVVESGSENGAKRLELRRNVEIDAGQIVISVRPRRR